MSNRNYRRTVFCGLVLALALLMISSSITITAVAENDLGKIKKDKNNPGTYTLTLCDCGCEKSFEKIRFRNNVGILDVYSSDPSTAGITGFNHPPRGIIKADSPGITTINIKIVSTNATGNATYSNIIIIVNVVPCPCKSNSMHGNSSDAPGSGGNEDTPGGSDQTPGKSGNTPGRSGSTPAHGAPPPGADGSSPGRSGKTPGQSENTPGHEKKAEKKHAEDESRLTDIVEQLKQISEEPNVEPQCVDKIVDAIAYIDQAIIDIHNGVSPEVNLLEAILLLKYVADFGCPYLADVLHPIISDLTGIYFSYL